ncbi:MAG: fibronectin type III domain-containing protein, partial [Anaerobutyricum sp.]|nr:fibronectin type III domain-containing protein [Anaerobutyricum sp.]
KVYFSVEKFTIGQGYLIEPCEVSITDGEPLSAVTERVLKANGYEPMVTFSFGWYLEGIKNADSGFVKVPLCFKNKWGDVTEEDDKDLEANDYSNYGYSGWMFLLNNNGLDVGASSTKVHNGDIIALRYSLTGGYDIGIPYHETMPHLLLPNLDSLTKSMAIFNANKQLCMEKGYQAAYNEALSFASNMDAHVIADDKSNQSQIEAKIRSLCSKLPTEATINQWKAEKAAAEQVALAQAEESRKVALYTPSVPTLKSVKSTKTRTAVITWKKNKKATGYEIYMSTKKASGYKKITTVKSWKKVTYTKKKLKKNKKYYFKVRAYKTAEGKKYYSAYSKVKAVKVK